MKHLSELLERLEHAEFTYKSADSSMDSSPLQVIVAKEELKRARFDWNAACSEFVINNVLNREEETEA